jgi:signal transduction histidine kinase
LRTALGGGRYVESVQDGNAFVVGLRLSKPGRGAVVTYSPLPDLRKELGIAQSEVVRSALIAVAVGAIVGLLIASLIAVRLRRIAHAAARIEQGGFDEPLTIRFRDEVGSLAQSVDQMRERLRASFRSLAAERDRLQRLLDSLDQGVITVDQALRVSYANGPALDFFGASAAEGSCFDPWPDFPLGPFVSSLGADGEGRVVLARAMDEGRTWAIAAVPAAFEDGDAILILGDVSERERRELAEREFVTNAAHELGTPVTAIAAALEALQSGAKDTPGQRDAFLSLIERQTTRLVRLRRALLMLARAQTGQESLDLEPVQVRPLLEEIAHTTVMGPQTPAIRVECDEDVVVLAREELLEQIVFGLTDNAIRHSGATTIILRARRIGREAELEVADDGIGVSPRSRGRLFDRFYQGPGRTSGFGLGLAVVRESVRALGGTVRVDSPVAGGTTMVIRLTAAVEVHA